MKIREWLPGCALLAWFILSATLCEAAPQQTKVTLKIGQLYNLHKAFNGPWRDFRLHRVNVNNITYRIGYLYDERTVTLKINDGIDPVKKLTLICEEGSTKFYYYNDTGRPNNCGTFVVERDDK